MQISNDRIIHKIHVSLLGNIICDLTHMRYLELFWRYKASFLIYKYFKLNKWGLNYDNSYSKNNRNSNRTLLVTVDDYEYILSYKNENIVFV